MSEDRKFKSSKAGASNNGQPGAETKEIVEKENGPWFCKSVEQVYENKWIRVSHHEVITPGATDGIYGVVHFRSRAVGIVALDEQQQVYLVRQFRYTLGQPSWEIPEGGCAPDEPTLDCAKRELKEETGLQASRWQTVLQLHLSNSVTDESGIVYLATDLQQGDSSLEATEHDLEVKKMPFAKALDMIDNGEITDAMSIAGLLKVARYLGE